MRLSQQRILFQTKSIESKRKVSVFINYLPKVKQTLLNHLMQLTHNYADTFPVLNSFRRYERTTRD